MVEKRDNNKPYDCFVAFLDIMGFKDRLNRDGHENVQKLLESLNAEIENIKIEAKMILQEQLTPQKTTETKNTTPTYTIPVSFSDSIILFSSDDSEDSALNIILDTADIIAKAISKEIPMKGAIAFGKMTTNTNTSLYLGQPLIDAYELHKELKIYGAVLHHSAEKRMGDLGMGNILNSLIARKYPVPMKSGEIEHHFINWAFMSVNNVNSIDKLYNTVSGEPRLYIDNTINYLDWIETQRAKL